MAKYKVCSNKRKEKESTFTLQGAKLGLYFFQALHLLKLPSLHFSMLPVCARKGPVRYENLAKILRTNNFVSFICQTLKITCKNTLMAQILIFLVIFSSPSSNMKVSQKTACQFGQADVVSKRGKRIYQLTVLIGVILQSNSFLHVGVDQSWQDWTLTPQRHFPAA